IQGPGKAFAGAAIPRIIVAKDPADDTHEIVYALVTSSRNAGESATDNGQINPNALYRSEDGGATWVNETTQLFANVPPDPFLPQPFEALTDFAVDPTNPDVVYVAVGDPTLYVPGTAFSNNGVYKSTDARSGVPDWTVAFGG